MRSQIVLGIKAFLRFRLTLWGLTAAAGTLAVVATGIAFLAPLSWLFDVFTHFRVQYCLGLALAALILLIRRYFRLAAWFGVCAIINLVLIAPHCLGGGTPKAAPGTTLRAFLSNVNMHVGDPWLVGQAIRKFDPDLVVLEEVNDRWVRQLRRFMKPYPYSKVETRNDCMGMSLYSKLPLKWAEVFHMGSRQLPWVAATVETASGDFHVLTVRTLPPFNQRTSRIRNNLMGQIPGLVRDATAPVLLLGDLNITPWSPHFQHLLVESGLKDSAQGRGFQPTWPAGHYLFMVPIDHCLYSEGIVIQDSQAGPFIGSDHYPLIVDFALEGRGG